MIAFLGMGLLGSNFVRALRRRGQEVQIWNRTHERAAALAKELDGVRAFESAADAVRGCERVHLTLSDDAAVDDVLEQARPGFTEKSVLVDHTTTSPAGTLARSKRWDERGIGFQHAPVFMGPKNALDSSGIMLASGDLARFDALAPELEKMTGKVAYLGPDPDRAAATKLCGNMFLMTMVAGLTDVMSLAKAEGIPNGDLVSLFELFNPASMLTARLKVLQRGEFTKPSWELAMARKDARLMMEAASQADMPLTLVPKIAEQMDRLLEQGHGKDDWTVIAKDVVAKSL